jgi:hypothetical protein
MSSISFAPLLLPVLAQVALTFVLLFWMGAARTAAIRRGEVKVKDIALGADEAWPPKVRQVASSFHSQLEMPILLYALVPLVLITGTGDRLMAGLAWAFVAARLAHVGVHVSSNDVPRRFQVFLVGVLILLAMWALLAWRVLAGR